MPGFLGLGTALGGFNEGYQKSQEAAMRQQLQQLAIAEARQKAQQQQQQQQAMETLYGSIAGGNDPGALAALGGGPGGAAAPQQPGAGPMAGGIAPAGSMNAAGPTSMPGRFGGMSVPPPGGNWETRNNNFAGMRKPGVYAGPNSGGFQSFATPEEGIQKIGYQLDRYASGATTGQPLTTLRQIVSTWAPPSTPQNPRENNTPLLIQRASQITGFSPDQPLDMKDPQVKAKLAEALIRNEQGGRMPVDPSIISKVFGGGESGGGIPPQVKQQGQQLAQAAAESVAPYGVAGQMSVQALVRQIEKTAPPGTPTVVKMMAVEEGMKLLAPGQAQQWQLFMEGNREKFQQSMEATREAQQNKRDEQRDRRMFDIEDKREKDRDKRDEAKVTMVEITQADGTKVPARAVGGKAIPLELPEGATGVNKMGTSSQAAPNPKTVDFVANGIAKYDMAPISGYALRTPFGQQAMAKVFEINPEYDQTKYQQKQRGAIAFTSGKQGDSVRSFSVSIDHLAVMEDAAKALAQNDVQTLNKLQNTIEKEFGYTGPVEFNFVKSIVGAEVSKAIIGGVSTGGERDALRNEFDSANTPEQLAGVANRAKQMMAGQLGGYRRQAGTAGFSQQDFEKALSPRAKQELETLPGGGADRSQSPAVPADLPDPNGVAEGSIAKDDSGKPVAVLRGGKWVPP